MYTLDTNAIIYYLKGEKQTALILEPILRKNTAIYISAITEAELFSFSALTLAETYQIETILHTLSIISLNSHIARITGMLRRQYHINIADCVIAATALFTNTTLITRNIQDFKKIANLQLLKI